MKHKHKILLCLLLLLGVFLQAQTLEEVPKRFSIVVAGGFQLTGVNKPILDGIEQWGYEPEGLKIANRTNYYFGINYRLSDHFSLGYRYLSRNTSSFTGKKYVPQERPCQEYNYFFGWQPVECDDYQDIGFWAGKISMNEIYTQWHNAKKSWSIEAGLFSYHQESSRFWGDIDENSGVSFSVGGSYNFAPFNFDKRLKAGIALNYYVMPQIAFDPMGTGNGAFPSKYYRSQLNIELGLSYLIF